MLGVKKIQPRAPRCYCSSTGRVRSKLRTCILPRARCRLSPLLTVSAFAFLIEELVRVGLIRFISASTTLAQGMNFPVAVVLVHSIHKPYGKGDLSPSEFWNIAGRAARLGDCEKGLIVFTNKTHADKWERYSSALTNKVLSALLNVLDSGLGSNLKISYQQHVELRPFFQYLAHAAATKGVPAAVAELEELLGASLANLQCMSLGASRSKRLRRLARAYLVELAKKKRNQGYLKAADASGLGSFSFDSLYAGVLNDRLLMKGPDAILKSGVEGYRSLVSALKVIPEFQIGLGKGMGDLDEEAVARVINGWVSGHSIVDLAEEFRGATTSDRVRVAGAYLHSKVSQSISWGAHAYIRGWSLRSGSNEVDSEGRMLPAYIQYGVRSPEAAVASVLGIPRQFAESAGEIFRAEHGQLTPSLYQNFGATLRMAGQNFGTQLSSALRCTGV